MINKFGFVVSVFYATYQSVVNHNETKFVHWMLWACVLGITIVLQEKSK